MVSIYGLNEKIGNISYFDSRGQDMFTKPYSDDRARVIDEEVSKMIEVQYDRALKLLTDNKEKLSELAEKLLSSEVIFKEDLEAIFGKRVWDKTEDNTDDSQEGKTDKKTEESDSNKEETDSNSKEEAKSVKPKPDLKTPPEFKEDISQEDKDKKDE